MKHAIIASWLLCAIASGLTHAQDPCVPQRIEPPVGTPPEKFGSMVATNDQYWFVADAAAQTLCPGSTFACSTGAVHVYELVDGQLEFTQTLVPPDIGLGDNYGYGMAAYGNRLIIGAPKHTVPGGVPLRGLLYDYGFDGTRWVETARIEPPAEVQADFGKRVVLHGDSMIVWNQVTRPDAVYAYRLVAGEWAHVQTLSPGPEAFAWDYGRRMVMDDDWLFVAAPDDDTITAGGGSVFIYQREGDGTFTFFQKVMADFFGRFGTDIAYNGRSLLVGVPAYAPEHRSQGGIFAYWFDGEAWVLDQRITLNDARRNDGFGWRVLVDGGVMLGRADFRLAPEGRGAVFQFEQRADGTWREVRRLVPNPLDRTGNFGFDMVIDGGLALVASLDEVTSSGDADGAAYLFDLSCNPCPADLDADGELTIFDFLAFFNAFDAGRSEADLDGDGEFTIFDFLAFQTAFDAGCG
ncbi:MAG: hypothetical protein NCW75_12485 [Phycisphaera sp.]|nr:MAG: hypothetical protein NCW75_12485 [Phycisphaera sp.]